MRKVVIEIKPETIVSKEGLYTIYDSKNKGGAIISDHDPFVAMEKFKEATILAWAVLNLRNFGKKIWYVPNFI